MTTKCLRLFGFAALLSTLVSCGEFPTEVDRARGNYALARFAGSDLPAPLSETGGEVVSRGKLDLLPGSVFRMELAWGSYNVWWEGNWVLEGGVLVLKVTNKSVSGRLWEPSIIRGTASGGQIVLEFDGIPYAASDHEGLFVR